jgi:hypothetical protein
MPGMRLLRSVPVVVLAVLWLAACAGDDAGGDGGTRDAGLFQDGPADAAAACMPAGSSCATGQTCCAGLECCSGVPVQSGAEFCSSNCPRARLVSPGR